MSSITYTLLIDMAPAPAELLSAIELVEVEQRSDAAAMFRLRIAMGQTDTGDYTPLADELFKPLTPVSLKVSLGSSLTQTLINGYVTAMRAEFGPTSRLEVVGMDATALMNLEEKVRTWPNMSDGDIATIIFGEYGLMPQVTPTQPFRMEMDVVTVQRSTDIRFLRRLAERNGYEVQVESDPLLGLPIGYFGPPRVDEPSQGVLSVNFGPAGNVSEFKVHYDMTMPAAAKAEGLDTSDGSDQSGEAESLSLTSLGADDTLSALPEKSLVLPSQTGLYASDELATYAQAVADRSAWAVTAEGMADPNATGVLLVAGKPVLVRGAGNAFSGTYLVDRVLHEWSEGTYTMRFTLRRNATGLKGTEVFL